MGHILSLMQCEAQNPAKKTADKIGVRIYWVVAQSLETQTNMRTPQIARKPDHIKKVCGNFLIWFRGIPI